MIGHNRDVLEGFRVHKLPNKIESLVELFKMLTKMNEIYASGKESDKAYPSGKEEEIVKIIQSKFKPSLSNNHSVSKELEWLETKSLSYNQNLPTIGDLLPISVLKKFK
jgi:hypothetical protein